MNQIYVNTYFPSLGTFLQFPKTQQLGNCGEGSGVRLRSEIRRRSQVKHCCTSFWQVSVSLSWPVKIKCMNIIFVFYIVIVEEMKVVYQWTDTSSIAILWLWNSVTLSKSSSQRHTSTDSPLPRPVLPVGACPPCWSPSASRHKLPGTRLSTRIHSSKL